MLKYLKFYNCNMRFKKRSHGYVDTKPQPFQKKFFFFFDSVVSFINLFYQGIFQVRLDSGILILGTSSLDAQISSARGKMFFESKHILRKCFSFLAQQRRVQLLNFRHINRSFNSFYSHAVLALQTDRLTNPRIKH